MKYNININQKAAIELGLTSMNQAAIFEVIGSCNHWAVEIIIDGKTYHWVARQKIAEQLPLINLKPDSIYREFKKLSDLGLIEFVKSGKKDCTRLTEKGKSYYVGFKSEKQQNSENNPKNNSDLNPTYNPNKVSYNPNKKETVLFLKFKEVYPFNKHSFDSSITIWNNENLDQYAELIIADVINRKKDDSTWLANCIHRPSKYLREKIYLTPIQTQRGQNNGYNDNDANCIGSTAYWAEVERA